jgi:hypothetical protein
MSGEDPGFIPHAMDLVDRVFEKHGLMPDHIELDTLLDGRPRKNYGDRSHKQLLEDVNALYDKLVLLVRERDELRGQVGRLQRKLSTLNLKFWIVSAAVMAEAGVITWLANQLFSRLH